MNKLFFEQGAIQVSESRVVLGRRVIVLGHVCVLESHEEKNAKVFLWVFLLLALLCLLAGVLMSLGNAVLGDTPVGVFSSDETPVALFVLAGVWAVLAFWQALSPARVTFKIVFRLSSGKKEQFITHERVMFNNVYRAINDALVFRSLKSF